MADTSDYYLYNDATGVIIPDTSDLLSDVQAEYQGVFGADFIVTPDTPQGTLITAEVEARTEVVKNNAIIANQINPNEATGIFLAAIMALTGVQPNEQTYTTAANVALTGVANSPIPEGIVVQTSNGDLFTSTGAVTLSNSGTATISLIAEQPGPIPCPAGSLTIVNGAIGLETVTNPAAGTLGVLTQGDEQARGYRNNTLAFQGVALPIAITSALYATTGVTSLTFAENYDAVPMGLLTTVAGGATLAGTTWSMSTTGGSASNGGIVVDTDPINFAQNGQVLPSPNPWPAAAFTTTGNITLSGLGTQSGGDWAAALTAGQIILVKNQTTASQNGLWVASSGAWTRQAYNASASTILGSVNGISLKPNSVYACVAGGANLDVAAALLENKSGGCGWNGNTTVNLVEPASGQTYPVQFDRPVSVPVLIKVTIRSGSPTDATNAVLDYIAGNISGMSGFVVGGNVSPFEIAGAINNEYPSIYVSSVQVTLASAPSFYSTNEIIIGQNQQASASSSSITIVQIGGPT